VGILVGVLVCVIVGDGIEVYVIEGIGDEDKIIVICSP
jgi:hypothetical protein